MKHNIIKFNKEDYEPIKAKLIDNEGVNNEH